MAFLPGHRNNIGDVVFALDIIIGDKSGIYRMNFTFQAIISRKPVVFIVLFRHKESIIKASGFGAGFYCIRE
jgi:hypothetical protein